ncbi:MAG: VanZ family protein [Thiohalobacteraceae bacterium]
MSIQINRVPLRGLLAVGLLFGAAGLLMLIADLSGRHIQDLSLRYPGSDKFIHFCTHLCFTVLGYWALRRYWTWVRATHSLWLAGAASLLLGLFDESQQYFVGGRQFDLFDIAANLCGTATGMLLLAGFTTAPRRTALLAVVPIGLFGGVYAHAYMESRLFKNGIQQIRAGDLAGAQRSFHGAIARGQGNATLYNELAWLELEFLAVDPAQPLHYSGLAVEADADNPAFLDTHGWALYRNGRYREALEFLQRAFNLDPAILCIHYHLGAVYFALGEQDRAALHLHRQLEVSEQGDYADEARALLARIDKPM